MIDSPIFTKEAIGKQWRIKKHNKNNSESSWEIKVLGIGQNSLSIEVLKGGENKANFFGIEIWKPKWLSKDDILEAIIIKK